MEGDNPVPPLWNFDEIPNLEDLPQSVDIKAFFSRAASGVPFADERNQYKSCGFNAVNLSLSECCECGEVGIWISDRLLYPPMAEAPAPNPDLPAGIRQTYHEAGSIINLSPRGAAALMRLCVQELCKELGEPGKNINEDIGSLVKKGLSVRVQQALDVLRVVGNNAVHPGQIDLRDDRATAISLFQLLNIIAEKMISEPKHIEDAFENLPPEARDQIARRDAKKT
jgi:hypothetical protein